MPNSSAVDGSCNSLASLTRRPRLVIATMPRPMPEPMPPAAPSMPISIRSNGGGCIDGGMVFCAANCRNPSPVEPPITAPTAPVPGSGTAAPASSPTTLLSIGTAAPALATIDSTGPIRSSDVGGFSQYGFPSSATKKMRSSLIPYFSIAVLTGISGKR